MTTGVFERFFHPGEVAEIRGLGFSGKSRAWDGFVSGASGGQVAGYFNDPAAFSDAARELDGQNGKAVYFTINPVKPDLLARAANRIKAGLKPTTQDHEIACLRWLFVDFDPKRPAGISSTKEELDAAKDAAAAVAKWLESDMGFARGLRALSGNGYHVLYRLQDLPPDDEHGTLLRDCLRALAARFSNAAVDIDCKNFNPARITKFYGTMARKGDSTAERPHRQSLLFPNQPVKLSDVPITGIDQLKALAKLAPEEKKSAAAPVAPKAAPAGAKAGGAAARRPQKNPPPKLGPIDMAAYLAHYGVEVVKVDDIAGGKAYRLRACVFNPAHGPNEASICHTPGTPPYMTYQCFHNSCDAMTWRDAKAKISGDDSLARFCEGYDPNWRPGPGPDPEHPVRTSCVLQSSDPVCAPGQTELTVDPPGQVDPRIFFNAGERGRLSFVPVYLANYLYMLFGPICSTNGVFWRYANGVWVEFPRTSIERAATTALGEATQPQYVDNAVKTLVRMINKEEHEWEAAAGYINCLNGMIDIDRLLHEGIEKCLVPHDPKYGSRVQVPCCLNTDAEWDRWAKFLREVFPGDHDNNYAKSQVLQQFYGYCFLQDCRFAKALFLYGTGANGKSTALNVLEALVGRNNTSTLTIGDLGMRFNTQFMQNKLVNIATETNTRDPLSTEIFKAAVSGDPVKAERKYGEPYQFRPFAKFLMAMNDVPVIPDKSFGLERRIIIIDFPRRFEEHEMDPELLSKLLEEKDGIFLWSLLGLEDLLKNRGFVLPDVVKDEKAKWLKGLYPLLVFAEECLEFDVTQAVHTVKLYEVYKKWCSEGGNRALSRNKFYDQICMNFPKIKRKEAHGEKRVPHFIGVGIKNLDWIFQQKEEGAVP